MDLHLLQRAPAHGGCHSNLCLMMRYFADHFLVDERYYNPFEGR